MKYLNYTTMDNIVTSDIQRGDNGPVLVVKGQKPFLKIEIEVTHLFDMLADSLHIDDPDITIRRRAYQLKGYSLKDAIEAAKK